MDKKIKSKDSAVISMQSFFKKNLELIDYAIKGKASPTEILASTNNGNDPVQQYSMQTLSPGTWVNDEVIVYFLKICLANWDTRICNREKERKRSHLFNSFFVQIIFDENNNDPRGGGTIITMLDVCSGRCLVGTFSTSDTYLYQWIWIICIGHWRWFLCRIRGCRTTIWWVAQTGQSLRVCWNVWRMSTGQRMGKRW